MKLLNEAHERLVALEQTYEGMSVTVRQVSTPLPALLKGFSNAFLAW